MKRVIATKPLVNFQLHLAFADGESGIVDLSDVVTLGGVFEPLRDPEYFRQVTVNDDTWTIEWPNGADLCPDVLYGLAETGKIEPVSAK